MNAPICEVHGMTMKSSRYGSGWYCPNKIDGQWCDGTRPALRYRCEECGASLKSAYCPSCQDPDMIVSLAPTPEPARTSGLNEDYHGHQ